jgi:hypothetical protein
MLMINWIVIFFIYLKVIVKDVKLKKNKIKNLLISIIDLIKYQIKSKNINPLKTHKI